MIILMKTSKRELIVFSMILITMLAGACGISPTAGNMTPTISLTDVNGTAQSAASTLFAQTMAAIPASTVMPTETQPASTTPTPLPFKALEGLRVAYIIDGNLFVQDSGKQAIQLTHSDQDGLMFSDDGKKIVLYRRHMPERHQVYVVNADGTGEQVVIFSDLPAVFGYNEFTVPRSLAFVPHTHQLLFNTNHNDLLLVDTDTGEMKQIATPGRGGYYFLVSPNGKWVAIQTIDHIDVIDAQGRIVRRNLVTYSAGYDDRYRWAPMFWTQDSSELIIVQPAPFDEVGRLDVIPRSVWRYPLNGRPGTETRLYPSPLGDALSVSPDDNWIAYSYNSGSLDPKIASGVYLGNLQDGTSQLLYAPQPEKDTGYIYVPDFYNGWSPDSAHFVVHDLLDRLFMGNIYGEIIPVRGGIFSGWINSSRYLLNRGVLEIVLGEVGKQELATVMNPPSGLTIYDPSIFIFLGDDTTP